MMDHNEEIIVGEEDEICQDVILETNLSNGWDYIFPTVYPQPLEQQPEIRATMIGNIPSKEDFPGEFNFRFSLENVTSGQHWVYSAPLKLLFIDMNKTMVIHFQMCPTLWTHSSHFFIRALPVYSSDDYLNVPVKRCTLHSCEDDPQRQAHLMPGQCDCESNNLAGHVVRAECSDANYLYDAKSERHSVRVVITAPQAGSDIISIPYSFACKTSCLEGMRRRPIYVIFTLEDEYMTVYGRQKLEVKICSCPKRDKKRQEGDYWCLERNTDNKKKRAITKEDVSKALNNTKQIKTESLQEPLIKNTLKQQVKADTMELKRIHNQMSELYSEMTQCIKRIDKNVEKLMSDPE